MTDTTAPRLVPVLPGDWDEATIEALGGFPGARDYVLSRWRAGERSIRGMHGLGMLVHHPALARAFLTFNAHIARTQSLTPRVRELVILRISWLRKSEYEFVQHVVIARSVGLTDAEIDRVQQGPDAPGWAPEDADIVRAVDELHGQARIGEATWQRLSTRFEMTQLLDLVFAIGCYEIMAMAFNTFDMQLEPGVDLSTQRD
jgi:alkylhydroperoxidase family enzyme